MLLLLGRSCGWSAGMGLAGDPRLGEVCSACGGAGFASCAPLLGTSRADNVVAALLAFLSSFKKKSIYQNFFWIGLTGGGCAIGAVSGAETRRPSRAQLGMLSH